MTDFKAKMDQIRFRLGSAPDPAGGAYSAPPDPLLDLDAASRQGEGLGWGRGGKREGKGREGGPQVTVEPGPLRDLLCHCVTASQILMSPVNIVLTM